MADQRYKDHQWVICNSGVKPDFNGAKLSVLMDIRDELKRMNGVLNCPNFLEVPQILREIRKNTTPKKRRKAKAK